MTIEVTRLHPHVGAEIKGVDIAQHLSEGIVTAIKQAFLDYSVIIFREQTLSPVRQIEFTRIFGQPDIHPLKQFHLTGYPEILVLSNCKDNNGHPVGLEDAGQYWHTDVSFTPKPSTGSLLYALKVPPKGGDTLFAGQYAAWDSLPTVWQEKLKGRKAFHGLNRTTAPKWTDEQLAAVKPVGHPIVRVHPETGKNALYAGVFVIGIEGMNGAELEDTIQFLYQHCSKTNLVYRHRWMDGDIVLWDNRCVLHHATTFDPKYTRHMHRSTIVGDQPAG